MDIDLYPVTGSSMRAFVLSFELDGIGSGRVGDLPRLSLSGKLKRTSYWEKHGQGGYPIIMTLHGSLCSETSRDELGASLQPLEDLPLTFRSSETEQYLNLRFALSERYVAHLEEDRITQQGGLDMRLALRFWGMVAVASPITSPPASQESGVGEQAVSDIVSFEGFKSGNSSATLRIPRSDWIDRFLPNLGYGRSVLVELPLTRTPPVPEEYKLAATALDAARKAFEREDYRGAMKYCRDVLEHLGKISSDGKLTTFCLERLEPVVGETKAKAIDGALNVLRGVVNAPNHVNRFVPDRAIAAYAIETLAVNLRYISAVAAM